jgi:hypothetical protein
MQSNQERKAMTAIGRTIQRTIRGRIPRLASQPETTLVHFHQGPQGQPAPCFDDRCPNPRLSV